MSERLYLPQITMVAITDRDHGKTVEAIEASLKLIQPCRTILFSDVYIESKNFECLVIDPLRSARAYNEWVVWKLGHYIESSHILLVQHDGYVLDPTAWTDEFLEYDYIGAPWRYGDGRNVGNGGFSLRSKKLHDILASDPVINVGSPEDEIICRLFRHYLEGTHGIKFAPEDLAHRFSFEMHRPLCKTFGFHQHYFLPYREPIVLRRTGAMGDVIMLEPIMEHFFNEGYRIILDCIPSFYSLFQYHHFLVEHIANCKGEDFSGARAINFDMAYEVTPRVTAIEAYFNIAGVKDPVIRNPRLNFQPKGENKLFNKYAVIHIDKTDMPHRNVYGIDWNHVKTVLNAFDFDVIQVGRIPISDHVGLKVNTSTDNLLAHVVAGADLFIGRDSGPAHIAMATGVKSIIFFGSVDPAMRYPDRSNLVEIKNECVHAGCYHSVIGVRGVDCVILKERPPCTVLNSNLIVQKIKQAINHEPIKY